MDKNIRILIIDDHAIVREGQRALLETEPGMEVVGEGIDGIEAVKLSSSLKPDVILMDLLMPRMGGIEAIEKIKAENPDINVLVLTSFDDDDKVYSAIRSGAIGYLLKDASPDEFLKAIRTVSRGESSIGINLAQKLMHEIHRSTNLPLTEDPLTEREMDVLKSVAGGLSNQEIADKLFISERTVRTHVSHILDKLHLANRTQATLYALRKGIAELN